MLSKFFKLLSGDPNRKTLEKYSTVVAEINALESSIQVLSDEELKAKTQEFQHRIREKIIKTPYEVLIPDDVPKMPGQLRTSHDEALQEVLDEILPEAFAVCREAGKRVLNMRHFDVQLLGGMQLHRGGIAEMQTGEGKTLVCTLAAYLNALSKRGVHIITVNDYLAKRDAEWMGKIYKFLGLSVGLIIPNKSPKERQEAYSSDITYGTNNEFGFDYLRDNMESSLGDCVQRPYYTAIVDEVDSILIDEARTPLIISGLPDASREEVYLAMAKTASELKKGVNDKDLREEAHYYVDEKARNVILTDSGIKKAENILRVKDLWDPGSNLAHHLLQALKAKELFAKDVDYIVKLNEESRKKEIVIVDEFTGRLMEGRRWGDGLHQAVEAKERVPIQEETLTMASITFQNLFRLYPKLAGMTGTAVTEAEEFEKIYNLSVLQIPTNKTNIRKDLNDVVYKNERAKFYAISEDIIKTYKEQRPVLVGTTSIEKSEALADMLRKPQAFIIVLQERIQRLLSLLEKQKKSSLLSQEFKKLLDRPGNITLSNIEGHLNTLMEVINSKDEDLIFAVESIKNAASVIEEIRKGLKVHVLNAKHHAKEAVIIRQAGQPQSITIATNMAGRGTDIILGGYLSNDPDDQKYDQVDIEAQKLVVGKGGLHVIGTERHESRRIDNQLRGRAARQGDPGSSRFYLSLGDNLMRIFGGDQISHIMTMLKADEDLPIEAGIISNAINNSQKKVEAHNFDIRKHILQYDDVINTQREVIYRERRQILEGKDIHENVTNIVNEHIQNIFYSHINPNTSIEIWLDDSNGPSPLSTVSETLKADLGEAVAAALPDKEELSQADFSELINKACDKALKVLEEKAQNTGFDTFKEAERQIMLHVIDAKWVEHLHGMDSLKEGIHLQSYGQKDPLIEYKKEAFDLFEALLANIKKDFVALLFHAQIIQKSKPYESKL
jgi:preprotein translocase subunit SecA